MLTNWQIPSVYDLLFDEISVYKGLQLAGVPQHFLRKFAEYQEPAREIRVRLETDLLVWINLPNERELYQDFFTTPQEPQSQIALSQAIVLIEPENPTCKT